MAVVSTGLHLVVSDEGMDDRPIVLDHAVVYTPAMRRDYGSSGNRWKSVGLTLAIYALMAAGLLVTVSTSFIPAPLPAALTVVNTAPPAPPPQTPPKPKERSRPVQEKRTARQPVKVDPLPPMKVSISPVVAPVPVEVPKPADPAPEQIETVAPKTQPAWSAPRLASNGPDTWEGRVLMQLAKKRHYPPGAMVRHEQGVPYVRFVMDRQGKVLSVSLERSSGVPDLDREALALPKRAQPLPKPPEDRPGDTLELVVPLEFFIH